MNIWIFIANRVVPMWNLAHSFAMGAVQVKLDGLGPNFNNQTGISEETYRLVMKEVFNLDISVWDPLVEKYYGTWAP